MLGWGVLQNTCIYLFLPLPFLLREGLLSTCTPCLYLFLSMRFVAVKKFGAACYSLTRTAQEVEPENKNPLPSQKGFSSPAFLELKVMLLTHKDTICS